MKNLEPASRRATISSSLRVESKPLPIHKATPSISSPVSPRFINFDYGNYFGNATQCRSYVITSTSSTNSSSNNNSNPKNNNTADTIASTEEMDKMLKNVLIEAKEISALAIQRKINRSRDSQKNDGPYSSSMTKESEEKNAPNENASSSRPSSNDIIQQEVKAAEIKMEIQDEINAAEALLRLTSNHTFRVALSLDQERTRKNAEKTDKNDKAQPQEQNVAVSLHSAFILVVNWLCSTLASCTPPDMDTCRDKDVVNFPSHLPPGDTSSSLSTTTLPTKESILLNNILYLQERSRSLNLPLTIPQYQTIATMIARYSIDMDLPIRLLDISTVVSEVYGNALDADGIPIDIDDVEEVNGKGQMIVQSQFFDGALKELLERNRMRDMIDVIEGMKALHEIDDIDPQLGIELLTRLKSKVDDSIQGDGVLGFDEVDAMELTLILQKPVMDALDSKRKELVQYQQIIGETLDTLLDYNEDNLDDEENDEVVNPDNSNSVVPDEGSDSAYIAQTNSEDDISSRRAAADEDGRRLEELVKIWTSADASEEEREAAKAEATSILKKAADRYNLKKVSEIEKEEKSEQKTKADDKLMGGMTARLHVDNETGEVENIELIYDPKMSSEQQKRFQRMQNEVMESLMYARDSSFEVPDIVSQLETWNDGIGLKFTKDYEYELAKEISAENGDIFDTQSYYPDDSKDDNRTT